MNRFYYSILLLGFRNTRPFTILILENITACVLKATSKAMSLFSRKNKRPLKSKIRESVWPSMGWRRTINYYKHRIFRTGDSTYRITAGLAMGGAVSFSPFIGTHFAQAILGSWLIRANIVAGFVGTALGNPWTFPFMFYLSYTVGVEISSSMGFRDFIALPDTGEAEQHPLGFLKHLFAHPLKLLLPMTLGGYLIGAVYWFLSFAVLYYPVKMMREAYTKQYRRLFKKDA